MKRVINASTGLQWFIDSLMKEVLRTKASAQWNYWPLPFLAFSTYTRTAFSLHHIFVHLFTDKMPAPKTKLATWIPPYPTNSTNDIWDLASTILTLWSWQVCCLDPRIYIWHIQNIWQYISKSFSDEIKPWWLQTNPNAEQNKS